MGTTPIALIPSPLTECLAISTAGDTVCA